MIIELYQSQGILG